jgi:hypothetical protein
MRRFRVLFMALIALASVTAVTTHASGDIIVRHATAKFCSATSLSDGVNEAGDSRVVAVQKFGCVGDWAFLWADVTAGLTTIGVTNVMRWRPDLNGWRSVDRMVVCRPDVLPEIVYRQGCFSN